MEDSPLDVAPRLNPVGRVVRRLALVAAATTSCVLLLQTTATASDGLSSVVLSNTEPGLVVSPLGPYNGSITQSNVDTVMGSTSDATSALGQALADGSVTAYIRSWGHQPPDGDGVVIIAFAFANGSEESSFAGGLAASTQRQSNNQSFAVPGISGASGAVLHTTASGTAISEYAVTFSKGNTVFQMVVASSSGDLTSANAVSLANQQFANAPDIPAKTSGRTWHNLAIVPPIGILLAVVVIVIGRKRKYPTSLTGGAPRVGPNWPPPPVVPTPANMPPSPSVGTLPTEARPKVSADEWQ
jgi:hypothetical protein